MGDSRSVSVTLATVRVVGPFKLFFFPSSSSELMFSSPSSDEGGGGGSGEDFSIGGRGGSGVGGMSLGAGSILRLLRASMGSKLGLLSEIPESILDGVCGVKEGEKQLALDGESNDEAACSDEPELKNRFGRRGWASGWCGVVASALAGVLTSGLIMDGVNGCLVVGGKAPGFLSDGLRSSFATGSK